MSSGGRFSLSATSSTDMPMDSRAHRSTAGWIPATGSAFMSISWLWHCNAFPLIGLPGQQADRKTGFMFTFIRSPRAFGIISVPIGS
jgi:hypothetical protein